MDCLAVVTFELYELATVLLVDPLELLGVTDFLALDLYVAVAVS